MIDKTTAKPATSQQKPKVPMSIDSFPLRLAVPFTVYDKEGNILFAKWTKFDQAMKNSLISKGITHLYIEGEPLKVNEFFNEKAGPSANHEADKKNYTSYSKEKDIYHHVSRLVFVIGARVTFSIYSVENLRFVPIINATPNKSAPVTDAVIKASGNLAIKASDMPLFREYLSDISKGRVAAPDNRAKVAGIKENVKMNVRDFISDPSNPKNTDGVINSANEIIGALKRKEAVSGDLMALRAKDFHLYNHSLNVAVLATAMAVALGMDQTKIEKLTIAAMMHDVGMGTIPPYFLTKADQLTADEFTIWKKHVSDGVRILQGKGLSRDSLDAIQQHHERLSGNGYPYGLRGSAINPFGRIMSIVDHYDGMRTPRPLKPAFTPAIVLSRMMEETAKGDFDSGHMKIFVNILKG